MSSKLVDWGMAERVAVAIAGGDDDSPNPAILQPAEFEPICAEALELARAYSRLEPRGAIPPPELVGRADWARSVLEMLSDLTDELERVGPVDVSLPGPLGRIARSLLGAATGTELGLASGYAARKVLGQYEIALVGAERPSRLLFVAPNLTRTAAELDLGLDAFVRWVALHESTHALQFAAAPWLREHLGGLVRELLGGAGSEINLGELLKRLMRDPKGAVSSFMRGDLAKALLGPGQEQVLQRVQATMTLIEGHAEHVMDGAAGEFVPGVEMLRTKLETRRSRRGPLETIMSRLLGLDLKLRQYRQGKAFCDRVVAEAGIEGLNRAWEGPEWLPSASELEHPDVWLERTQLVAAS